MQEKGGIPPALQKLSYAGKHFEDSQRTLQQYGYQLCFVSSLLTWAHIQGISAI